MAQRGWLSLTVALSTLLTLVGGVESRAEDRQEIVFAAYNLENYFQASDFPAGTEKVSKTHDAIDAEIEIIAEIHPDILGVCEMGPPAELADFQARLKTAGLDLPNKEYVDGPDPERHLALLSTYPIKSSSITDASFQMGGRVEKVRRGILDVTVDLGETTLRLVGVHLKSKVDDTPEDEADLRRNEAHLVRKHVDEIMNWDPAVNLVVYGDFNDTKNEATMKEIMGPRGAERSLDDLWLKDANGETWTEYWKFADVYSRIDYILVSHALKPAFDYRKGCVYASPLWDKASDHRPLVAAFRLNKIE